MRRISNENQKRYDEQDKDKARQTDIVDFLTRYEGFSFKKAGRYLRCIEHDSLMIYPDRKGWFWNSIDTGGASALDYLQKIHNMDFPEAMSRIIGEPETNKPFRDSEKDKINIQKPVKEAVPERVFSLPEPTKEQYTRIFAYLNKTRLIDVKIISALMHEKKIYQDNRGNAVFVGFNKEGEAKYAAARGTLSEVQYRGDVAGSDKSYGFTMNGIEKNRVYVFESPVDTMSHATLANLILNDEEAWKQHNRLSLGGVSDNALERYLFINPEIKEVVFCLDNDKAGLENTEKYMKKYAEKGYNVRSRPPKNKDYNNDLGEYIKINSKENSKQIINENNTVLQRTIYR